MVAEVLGVTEVRFAILEGRIAPMVPSIEELPCILFALSASILSG
jgi:hypothetical protein